MNEWLASFIGCLIGMVCIRFVVSIGHESPYWRGYRDGYRDGYREAIEAYKKYGMKPEEDD